MMSAPPDELPGRTRPPVRRWRLALSLVVVAAAAVGTLPDLLGLDRRGPFAQLVAFRPALLAGLLVVTAVAVVAAGVRRRGWTLAGGLLARALKTDIDARTAADLRQFAHTLPAVEAGATRDGAKE